MDFILQRDFWLLISLTLNLIGVMLTVSSKIRSNNFQIDGGNFSDPNSGFIEIRLGWGYKIGWLVLCVGVAIQILIVIHDLLSQS